MAEACNPVRRDLWHRRESISRFKAPNGGGNCPTNAGLPGEMRPLAEEFLLGKQAQSRGFFDPVCLRRMFEQHMNLSQDHSARIWALMVLEALCRTFHDREDPLAGPLKFA